MVIVCDFGFGFWRVVIFLLFCCVTVLSIFMLFDEWILCWGTFVVVTAFSYLGQASVTLVLIARVLCSSTGSPWAHTLLSRAPPALLFPGCLGVPVALLPGVLGSQVCRHWWEPRDPGTHMRPPRLVKRGWVTASAVASNASGHRLHLPRRGRG